jgi:4-hydroxythreonine-4-phosphate dehydrogenase
VTAPINKEAWQAAGIDYPGHTELFAERAASDRFCMMMTAPAFSCSLVTTHVGYAEVPTMLTVGRILEVIQLTNLALKQNLGRPPKLVALGLNPHAGEHGLFGDREEERVIEPAVRQAIEQGIDIEGPIPPDTGFIEWRREQTDGYICMYHDQGLIPFKALNFDTGVNTTLGLPIIRTSVDHGTALDIAWQGKAEVSSLIAAVELAAKLAKG